VDVFLHDTYFIVGHLHYVLFGGSLFGAFAAIYFWFPKMFGRTLNDRLGKLHFVLTFIAFNLVFFPMFILGVNGMPRRLADPYVYQLWAPLQGLNQFMTIGALVLGFTQLIFLANVVRSLIRGRRVEANPWQANTLEWVAASSPPLAHGNFETIPVVYRGAYEYSSPDTEDDWFPQTAPPAAPRREHGAKDLPAIEVPVPAEK
jgi:cytochrome c oxidase subunit 1